MGIFSSQILLVSTDETTPEHCAPQCRRDEVPEKVQQSSTKIGGGDHLSPARKSWGSWECLPWGFSATGWFYQCTWREGRDWARLCSIVCCDGIGPVGATEIGNSLGTSGNVFYTASFPLAGCPGGLGSLPTLELYKSILDTVIGRFLEVALWEQWG